MYLLIAYLLSFVCFRSTFDSKILHKRKWGYSYSVLDVYLKRAVDNVLFYLCPHTQHLTLIVFFAWLAAAAFIASERYLTSSILRFRKNFLISDQKTFFKVISFFVTVYTFFTRFNHEIIHVDFFNFCM